MLQTPTFFEHFQHASQTIVSYTQKPASVFTLAEALVDADTISEARADLSNARHMTFNFLRHFRQIRQFLF